MARWNKYRAKLVWVFETMPYTMFDTKAQAEVYFRDYSRAAQGLAEPLGELIKFDSRTEYRRWLELLLLVEAGEIFDLERQPTWELQPGFRYKGKKYQSIKYSADFSYHEKGKPGVLVIEDVKSETTRNTKEFRRTFRLFAYPHLGKLESGEWDFRLVEG